VTDGHEGVDVGDRVRVELVGLNVPRGFIDFVRAGGEAGRRPLADQGRETGHPIE
jgi:hypothetical protein